MFGAKLFQIVPETNVSLEIRNTLKPTLPLTLTQNSTIQLSKGKFPFPINVNFFLLGSSKTFSKKMLDFRNTSQGHF